MKHITKLAKRELKKLDSKIKQVKQSGKVAFACSDFNAWGEYEKIADKLNYRRLCINHELLSLTQIQEEK